MTEHECNFAQDDIGRCMVKGCTRSLPRWERELIGEKPERDRWKDSDQIAEQRAKGWTDFHPEDYCHRCGGRNITPWYADSALWNRAMPVYEIACPQCFVEAYEEATGERPIWRLAPAEQSDELSALTKSEAEMRHALADAQREVERLRTELAEYEQIKPMIADGLLADALLLKRDDTYREAADLALSEKRRAHDALDEIRRAMQRSVDGEIDAATKNAIIWRVLVREGVQPSDPDPSGLLAG